MSNFEPGNPKGWGDPVPLVMLILLLIFFGGMIGGLTRSAVLQQSCQQFNPNAGFSQ